MDVSHLALTTGLLSCFILLLYGEWRIYRDYRKLKPPSFDPLATRYMLAIQEVKNKKKKKKTKTTKKQS